MPARGGTDGAQAGGPPPGAGNNAGGTTGRVESGGWQALSANWQSALCVTSVYDAMARLQQENDALREELRAAKQTHALIAAKAVEAKQAREPERVGVCEKHEQEIRLLRREKLQLERLGEQQRAALEARAREAEAACQQQITKYQERHALDPNAAKRVALSVQTLRDTLDKVVEEKEELAIRYSQLNKLYAGLQQEHTSTVATLQGKVAGLKAQRGMQRVVTVLSRWSASNVERAWRIWTTHTKLDRVQAQERAAALQTRNQLQEHVHRLLAVRLGEIVSRSALTRAREVFALWRAYSSAKRRHRQNISAMTLSRSQRSAKWVFESWRAVSRRESNCRAGLEKISSLLHRHKTRGALRKWTRRTQVEYPQTNFIHEKSAMQHEITTLADALQSTRQELEAARKEMQLLLSSRTDERKHVDEILQQKLEMELAIKEKVGRFLRKQSDRHLVIGVMSRWRGAAVALRALKKREEFVRARLYQRRLQLSITRWQSSLNEGRKYAAILHRLRNIRAVRCFNSWKEATVEASARKSALRQALFTMQHQQTAKCFAQWKDFRGRQRQVKRQLQWLVTWTEKRLLSQALSRWKAHLRAVLAHLSQLEVEQSRVRLESDYTQHKQQLVLLLQCFYQWRRHVKTQTDRTKLLSKYAARLKSNIQMRAMQSWAAFRDSRKQAREFVRRWIYRSYSGHLAVALATWKRYTLSETHSATHERLTQQHGIRVEFIEQQLTSVQMMREELHQQLVTKQEQHDDAYQGVLTSLHAANRRRRRLNCAVDALCSRHARQIALRKALVGWYEVATDVKVKRQIVRDFRARASIANLQFVFSAWRDQWMRRKRIATTVDRLKRLHAFYSLTVVLDGWIEFRRQQNRVKEFARLCLSRTNSCNLAEVIRGWRRVTRTSHLLRTAVSNALYRSATGQMKFAFSRWQSLTRDLATAEKEARRKQTIDDIRTMISVKWSLSAVRKVFVCWKSVVATQRARYNGGERLQSWYQRWLLQQCLSAWQTSLNKQAALDTWLRRWMTKTVTRKQERALRVWKSAVLRSQMEDVQALRALYEQECNDARQCREEISELKASSRAMSAQLIEMETAHAHAVQELEHTNWLVMVTRCFGAWKQRTLGARRLSHLQSAFYMSCERKRVAFFVNQWRGFVQDRRSLRQEAQERWHRVELRTQRACFQNWRFVVETKAGMKRKEKGLRSRRDEKRKQKILASWCLFTSQARAVTTGANQLAQAMGAVELRVRFSQWVSTSRALKQLELRAKERQLRLEQLTERVCERICSQTITAWLQVVKSRQNRLQDADLRFKLKCLGAKRMVLDQWRSHLQLRFYQRQKLGHLSYLRQRVVFQSAWRSWTNCVHRKAVASLMLETRQLQLQQEQAAQQLRATATDLDHAKTALAQARSALSATELRLTYTSSQLTHKEVESLNAAARTAALQRIVHRRFVPRSVTRSFRLWREQCEALQARHRAVRQFALVIHRQHCLHAFSRWRKDCKMGRGRQRFQRASRIRALRRHLQQWKRVVNRRAAAKLFLARRLLVCLSGPQRLSWGFRLWRLATAATRAIDHVGVLSQDIQRRSEQSAQTRRRFLLAKWLWAAYVHRLGQMHAFIVRCQKEVAAASRTDHDRVIQRLQDTHTNESIAREEKAAQALLKCAQRAKEDACSCEAVVTGPSLRAIKALLHRVSQATALHELFTSVSGTFGQFLHGCSGRGCHHSVSDCYEIALS